MKKPCKGEKIGLRIELSIAEIFFCLLFLNQNNYPQIPINGFCKYNSIKTDSGYTSFFSLNYNSDSYADLFLFNPNDKKCVTLIGDNNGTFTKENEYELPFEISRFQSITEKNGMIKEYAFTSRKTRQVGTLKFNSKGKPEIETKIELKSYPENLSIGDIENDGQKEILVSGSSFEGLSILFEKNKKLIEKKVIGKTVFSSAVLTDLSNDDELDIAAFNVITNSINFFYNIGDNNFNRVRSIPENEKIYSLISSDINLDDYADLIFVKGNSINILYGDYTSSYEESVALPTKNFPDKIVIRDFNKDGKMDIAYINKNKSTLSVFFAKNTFEFYPEIVYLQSEGVTDLIPYYSKFIDGLALLNSNGKIITLTRLASISEGPDLALGVAPSSIKYFDLGNNGINDIAFIDKFTNSLTLITRNNAGIPSKNFNYKLHEIHNDILIDNSLPLEKTFYCYSLNKRLIEVLDINFSDGSIKRTDLYSPGNILDLKYKSGNEKINIYIVYKKGRKLGAALYENKNFTFYLNDYPDVLSNVLTANISLINQPSIYAWNKEKDSLNLSVIKFGSSSKKFQKIFAMHTDDDKIKNTFLEDFFLNNKDVLLSFFKLGGQKKAIVNSVGFSTIYKNFNVSNLFSYSDENNYFYGEARFNGMKKLFVYNPESSTINKISFINGGRNIIITNIADQIDVGSFFIKNMNSKSFHLVYINNSNNCITIQKL